MNARVQYENAFSGCGGFPPPRIPIVMQFAAEFIGKNYGVFASDHRMLVEANLRCAEHFGFEQLSCISDPYRETSAFGAEIRFPDNQVPVCARPPLRDVTEAEALRAPNPHDHVRTRDRIDAVKLYRELIGDTYSVLGWVEGPAALSCDLLGMSDFLMDLMEDAEACEPLLRLCTDTSLAFARAQIEAGADTIGIGDAVCSQISGTLHREAVVVHQRRLVEGIRAAGGRVRLHICGQTAHLWDALATLHIDILDCDHMVDISAAVKIFPENVMLAGNHDPVSLLRFGSAEQIHAQSRKCREAAGSRWMINAGCEIPSGSPYKNLFALCNPEEN